MKNQLWSELRKINNGIKAGFAGRIELDGSWNEVLDALYSINEVLISLVWCSNNPDQDCVIDLKRYIEEGIKKVDHFNSNNLAVIDKTVDELIFMWEGLDIDSILIVRDSLYRIEKCLDS